MSDRENRIKSDEEATAMLKRYKVCGRVVMRKIGDETLLVPVSGPVSGGRVYPINETARLIWEGLSGGLDAGRIVERLVQAYAVSSEEAAADCAAFIKAMVSEALLEEVT